MGSIPFALVIVWHLLCAVTSMRLQLANDRQVALSMPTCSMVHRSNIWPKSCGERLKISLEHTQAVDLPPISAMTQMEVGSLRICFYSCMRDDFWIALPERWPSLR